MQALIGQRAYNGGPPTGRPPYSRPPPPLLGHQLSCPQLSDCPPQRAQPRRLATPGPVGFHCGSTTRRRACSASLSLYKPRNGPSIFEPQHLAATACSHLPSSTRRRRDSLSSGSIFRRARLPRHWLAPPAPPEICMPDAHDALPGVPSCVTPLADASYSPHSFPPCYLACCHRGTRPTLHLTVEA